MTREEILKDPEVSHYCDAKRGWVHEAFMDGVDYAERKTKNRIEWQTGEPKEKGNYIISYKNGDVGVAYLAAWAIKLDAWKKYLKDDVIAWCKLSDIEPYKEEIE